MIITSLVFWKIIFWVCFSTPTHVNIMRNIFILQQGILQRQQRNQLNKAKTYAHLGVCTLLVLHKSLTCSESFSSVILKSKVAIICWFLSNPFFKITSSVLFPFTNLLLPLHAKWYVLLFSSIQPEISHLLNWSLSLFCFSNLPFLNFSQFQVIYMYPFHFTCQWNWSYLLYHPIVSPSPWVQFTMTHMYLIE